MSLSIDVILEKLNTLFSAEYHSLTQLIVDASPYVEDSMQEAWQLLQEILAEEKQSAQQLAELISKLDGVPDTESFNPDLGDINYLSLKALLPRIIRFKRDLVHRYEDLIMQCSVEKNEPSLLLKELCSRTQSHINLLQQAKGEK